MTKSLFKTPKHFIRKKRILVNSATREFVHQILVKDLPTAIWIVRRPYDKPRKGALYDIRVAEKGKGFRDWDILITQSTLKAAFKTVEVLLTALESTHYITTSKDLTVLSDLVNSVEDSVSSFINTSLGVSRKLSTMDSRIERAKRGLLLINTSEKEREERKVMQLTWKKVSRRKWELTVAWRDRKFTIDEVTLVSQSPFYRVSLEGDTSLGYVRGLKNLTEKRYSYLSTAMEVTEEFVKRHFVTEDIDSV